MKFTKHLRLKSLAAFLLSMCPAHVLFADNPTFDSGLQFLKQQKATMKGYVEEGFDYATYISGGILIFTLVKIGYGKFKGRETDGSMIGWAFGTGIMLLAFQAVKHFFLK